MSSARSRINTSSQLMYGSHSAPLSSSCGPFSHNELSSLFAVGNAAPPSPTMPPRAMCSQASFGEICSNAVTAAAFSNRSSRPSLAITMQSVGAPNRCGAGRGSMAITSPDTGECNHALMPGAGCAIGCPMRTRSEAFTSGTAGRPRVLVERNHYSAQPVPRRGSVPWWSAACALRRVRPPRE